MAKDDSEKGKKMPRANKTKTKKTGRMTLARESIGKILKIKEDDWRVTLDSNLLKEPLPHVPTGSLVVDYLIGGEPNSFGVAPCPGFPRARMSQIWGHESAGKTTLALTAAATTCQAGGTVLYVDWENDIVPDYAAALGVPITDPDRFELAQPETLEMGIKIATIYAHAGVDLIIFDSVGAPTTERLANRPLHEITDQAKVGELQAVWSTQLANLKRVINKSGTAIVGISQIRAKISTGGGYGGPTTQPQGGNAWKFYSSVRLELRRIKQESSKLHNVLTHKKDDRVTGGVIQCHVVKCKLSKSQGRKELFYIRWGEGIDDLRTVMEIAIGHGIIKKSGAWLAWEAPDGETVNLQGTDAFRKHLLENESHFDALYGAVIPHLGNAEFSLEEMEELPDMEELFGEEAEDEISQEDDLSEPGGDE